MKKLIFLLVSFLSLNTFAQDLTTDSCRLAQGLSVWYQPSAQNSCYYDYGYSDNGSEVINFSFLSTVNMDTIDAIFPESAIFFNTCNEQREVKNLYTVNLSDSCGNLISSTNISMRVYDHQNILRWLAASSSCLSWYEEYGFNQDNFGSIFFRDPSSVIDGNNTMGITAGYWSEYNPFPGGFRNRINIKGKPNGIYKLDFIGNFNNFFNQGKNSYPDVITIFVEISGNVGTRTLKVVSPYVCTPVDPCSNPVGISALERNGRTFTWKGSECTEKTIKRTIVKGNQIKDSYTFTTTGNTWTDNTAFSQNDLKLNGFQGATYTYVVSDGINTLTLSKIRY